MDRTNQLELVAALLEAENTLTLATADESGLATAAPLFFIADDEFCVYWVSSRDSLHSENLQREPRAAVTIYRHAENWKEICGVQMRGKASTVTSSVRRKDLIYAYSERLHLGTIFRSSLARSTLYVFRPDYVRYIDNSRRFGFKFELTFEYPAATPPPQTFRVE
jgi:uncharacterized protein YhbP (UPF0306 family)